MFYLNVYVQTTNLYQRQKILVSVSAIHINDVDFMTSNRLHYVAYRLQ